MEREIKFRAFEKGAGFFTTKLTMDCLSSFLEDENMTVEQFTGLKDNNGVEIYEGDIVKTQKNWYGHNTIFKIVYVIEKVIDKSTCCSSYEVEYTGFILQEKDFEIYEFINVDASCLEVVGNIHENEDLLK